jgi:hypothetical protein
MGDQLCREHNYDLCQACFEEHGRAEDYDRIDRPLFRPRHLHPPMFGGPMVQFLTDDVLCSVLAIFL